MTRSRDEAREPVPLFTPLVARALDLGRGPPALLRWVAARRGLGARDLANRLARELTHGPARPGDTLAAAPARRTQTDGQQPRTTGLL